MTKNNIKQIVFSIVLSLVAIFAYANVTEAVDCFHTYNAATCTKAKTCTKCGKTSGYPLGHNYVINGNIARCTECGASQIIEVEDEEEKEEQEQVHVHTWKAATCTTPKTCSGCGATSGYSLGHNFDITVSNVMPTCEYQGQIVKKCIRCSKTETTTSPALGHNYKTTQNTTATCTTAGVLEKKCSNCGDTIRTTSPALGHNYKTTQNTTATCTTAGVLEKKCSNCGDIIRTTSPALGHNYKTTQNTTATCTTAGILEKKCSNCGDIVKTTSPALGHNYKTTTIAATCIAYGKVTKTCSNCGDTTTSTINPTGHKFVVSSSNATCTIPGSFVKKCSVCGLTETANNQALGHNFVEKSKTNPTCTENGKLVKVCTRCSENQETVIPALGHDESIVFNSEYHWYECDRCNNILGEKEVHEFKNNKCVICGYTYNDDEQDEKEESNGELIIEPWMKENDELDCLAVSLRSEPYEEDRVNKNIYELDEKVIYYVDYKNGGRDTEKEVTLVLNLPLSFSVIDSDGASVSKSKKTLTWTFDGMENEESGTKVVVVKYTSLGKSSLTYKRITPKATISLGKAEKDVSAVLNLVVKDFETEVDDEHEPYMYGDKDTGTFRPDDPIDRGEGALVLTRIFGISTKYDTNTYAFPDLNETYLEARKAVIAATAHGLIEGYPDGTYKPRKHMTRAEFITILARQIEEEYGEGFEVKDESSLIKVYKDKTKIYYISGTEYYDSHWSLPYATSLARLNMTALSEDERNLRLDEPITRAEVAQLVNFYLLRAPADVTSSTKSGFPDVNKRHKLFTDIIEATRKTHSYSYAEDGYEVKE